MPHLTCIEGLQVLLARAGFAQLPHTCACVVNVLNACYALGHWSRDRHLQAGSEIWDVQLLRDPKSVTEIEKFAISCFK